MPPAPFEDNLPGVGQADDRNQIVSGRIRRRQSKIAVLEIIITMKISARNIFKGKIKAIKKGPISSIVTLEVAPGIEIVSSITSDSAAALKLKKGQTACAIIKASSVLIGTD